jgi:hypothetical protein
MEDGASEYLCFLQGLSNKYLMASLDEVRFMEKSDQRQIHYAWLCIVMALIDRILSLPLDLSPGKTFVILYR